MLLYRVLLPSVSLLQWMWDRWSSTQHRETEEERRVGVGQLHFSACTSCTLVDKQPVWRRRAYMTAAQMGHTWNLDHGASCSRWLCRKQMRRSRAPLEQAQRGNHWEMSLSTAYKTKATLLFRNLTTQTAGLPHPPMCGHVCLLINRNTGSSMKRHIQHIAVIIHHMIRTRSDPACIYCNIRHMDRPQKSRH